MLSKREWKEFFINKLNFKNFHGKRLVKNKRIKGKIPLLTAGENNNGVAEFIDNKEMKKFKDVISVDMFGNSFYHSYICCGDDNIYFFENKNLSKFQKLFITQTINKNKIKFSYGSQFRQPDADRLKILLPTKNNQPDYQFMENYTKSLYQKKFQKYINYIKKQLSKIEYKKISTLKEKEWREFIISDLFDIKIGKNIDGCKIDKNSGKTPYITRKENNNGYDGFISFEKDYLNNISKPVITIGNETAKPFVQISSFFTGTKVNIMTPKYNLSKEVLFFIARCLEQQKVKYSYSFTINSTRLKRQKILFPINDKNEPDYEYMEQYIKNLMFKKINQYLKFVERQGKI